MSTTQELRSIDTEAPRQPKTKRIVSVTAAIAVVVVVAAIALINRSGATLSPEEQLVVDRVTASEAVVEAFYSLDEQRLRDAAGSELQVDWIFGGQEVVSGRHTIVLNREPCTMLGTSDQVVCRVATDHDLTSALSYEGAETITLTFSDRDIIGVAWEEVNLPVHVDAFWDWVIGTKPGFFDTNCEGPDDDAFSCSAAACPSRRGIQGERRLHRPLTSMRVSGRTARSSDRAVSGSRHSRYAATDGIWRHRPLRFRCLGHP